MCTQMSSWRGLESIADDFIFAHNSDVCCLTALNEKTEYYRGSSVLSKRNDEWKQEQCLIFDLLSLMVGYLCLVSRQRLMRLAAVQRTILGGECVAALWLHDAQIQKHVSHTRTFYHMYSMLGTKVRACSSIK